MTTNEVANLQAITGQVQLQNTLNAIQGQLAAMQNQSAAMQNQLTAVGNQFNQFEQMFPIRLHNVSASHTAVLLGPAGPIPANLPHTLDTLIKATAAQLISLAQHLGLPPLPNAQPTVHERRVQICSFLGVVLA
ncbi:hypothetical protein VKT23_002695 [Stygiomarasmius scandens]|uniref:Uncharacterized protein n=1 Tax=Marasmiellus scandens TaxID=2682957 RepID=A0ABR1K6S7_9AGAR